MRSEPQINFLLLEGSLGLLSHDSYSQIKALGDRDGDENENAALHTGGEGILLG